MGDYPKRSVAANPPVHPPRLARQPLDRTRILTAAIEFIDEQGRDQLTMRQLGARLGVEAMALYRYVPSREQMLDGVVEVVMDEIYRDSRIDEPAEAWQDYFQRLAHHVREVALAHPQIFPLVATRPPAAPWLRPPLRSLRWVEAFLEALHGYGFSSSASVEAYRAFATFLLGHLLLEVGTPAPLPTDPDDDMEVIESNDLADYPWVTSLAAELAGNDYASEFEAALEDLITRIELVLSR